MMISLLWRATLVLSLWKPDSSQHAHTRTHKSLQPTSHLLHLSLSLSQSSDNPHPHPHPKFHLNPTNILNFYDPSFPFYPIWEPLSGALV